MGNLGEYRVGITFNPSANPKVTTIKQMAADLINEVESLRNGEDEVNRLVSLAQTHLEDAAMWAVKAATKEPKHG